LYIPKPNPLTDTDSILELIAAPTRWLVNHASVTPNIDRLDTTLAIDTDTDIPDAADNLERLLFWAIVLAKWWGDTLKYLAHLDLDDPNASPTVADLVNANPLASFGSGFQIVGEPAQNGSIDAMFDEYDGNDRPTMPDFLKDILDRNSSGTGKVEQDINLPAKDSGPYRENLVTCEEQDPSLVTFSQQSIEYLLPPKPKAKK
jgi:hypothetical protein